MSGIFSSIRGSSTSERKKKSGTESKTPAHSEVSHSHSSSNSRSSSNNGSSSAQQMSGTIGPIRVFSRKKRSGAESEKPAHWVDSKGTSFKNPWSSFHAMTKLESVDFVRDLTFNGPSLASKEQIRVRTPTWGLTKGGNAIKATWLGHAGFLIELPSPPGSRSSSSKPSRGARILFDAVLENRSSPNQSVGPKRFTKAPCAAKDIPEVDAIVISHDHYDHWEESTIKTLMNRPRPPHIFVPLGNRDLLLKLRVPPSHIHTMDWWESCKVEVDDAPSKIAFELTCTPSQHRTGRSLADNFRDHWTGLWSSWVVREILPSSGQYGAKVYFAGDTGYRYVKKGQNEEDVPFCPAFREIGKRFGPFDFAMLPIGAYTPRHLVSAQHCSPEDSVHIFKDIQAKKALGMHWGTFVLTKEDILEPPRRLADACKKANIPAKDFTVCDIGETVLF